MLWNWQSICTSKVSMFHWRVKMWKHPRHDVSQTGKQDPWWSGCRNWRHDPTSCVGCLCTDVCLNLKCHSMNVKDTLMIEVLGCSSFVFLFVCLSFFFKNIMGLLYSFQAMCFRYIFLGCQFFSDIFQRCQRFYHIFLCCHFSVIYFKCLSYIF